MFHNAKDLKRKNIEKFIFLLENLKNKIINKYGLSAYDLDDIEYVCKISILKFFKFLLIF